MKLLITGVPGTGKTSFGEYLIKEGYLHYDIESADIIAMITKLGGWRNFIEEIKDPTNDTVITWGFVPTDSNTLDIIHLIRKEKFRMIWFDGDRKAAEKSYFKRNKESKKHNILLADFLFQRQMKRINESEVIKIFNPIIINTFNSKHNYKSFKTILKEIEKKY